MFGTNFRLPMQIRIRSYLKVLVLSCLVPVCLSSAYLIHRSYKNGLAFLEQNLQVTADMLSVALDRDLAISRASLESLATSPALASGDMATFHAQAINVLKHFPDSDIILADATGQQVINSYKPFGEPLPKRKDQDTVRRIFATGKPVISNVFKGAVTGRYLVGVDVPVFLNGEVRYDLAITLPADHLSALFLKHQFQQEWLITIVDSGNTIASRSRLPEVYTGTHLESPAVLKLMAVASQGTAEGVNKEGVPSTIAFKRSDMTGWTVLVSSPRVIMANDLKRRLQWTVAGLTLLFVFGFAVALVITRIISRSVQDLIKPALALGRGEPVAPGYFELTETAEVAKALSLASSLLQEHGAERQQAENTLKELNETLEERINERTAQLTAANAALRIENTERKQAEEALQKAFDEIRTLRGIIPICANCKKIRDDKGFWNQVEVYIEEHTEAVFSHGLCMDCVKKLYPDLGLTEDVK